MSLCRSGHKTSARQSGARDSSRRQSNLHLVAVKWLTAFLDIPEPCFEQDCRFWETVTRTRRSAPRGRRAEFTTFVPDVGDAYFRAQRIDTALGGIHLDVHVDDPHALAEAAVRLGGSVAQPPGEVTVLRSPAGLQFCAVAWHGEQRRPPPLMWAAGHRSLLDQVCLDIPPRAFGAECTFWAAMTGWELHAGSRQEFSYLARPAGMPLRLLLQRLGDDRTDFVRAHLDIATSDAAGELRRHQDLGATIERSMPAWTTLRDPAGVAYCITLRDPGHRYPSHPYSVGQLSADSVGAGCAPAPSVPARPARRRFPRTWLPSTGHGGGRRRLRRSAPGADPATPRSFRTRQLSTTAGGANSDHASAATGARSPARSTIGALEVRATPSAVE